MLICPVKNGGDHGDSLMLLLNSRADGRERHDGHVKDIPLFFVVGVCVCVCVSFTNDNFALRGDEDAKARQTMKRSEENKVYLSVGSTRTCTCTQGV